jgi:hypothetical protein
MKLGGTDKESLKFFYENDEIVSRSFLEGALEPKSHRLFATFSPQNKFISKNRNFMASSFPGWRIHRDGKGRELRRESRIPDRREGVAWRRGIDGGCDGAGEVFGCLRGGGPAWRWWTTPA